MHSVSDIAQIVSQRRKSLGITQQDLAFTTGVNRRVIGELERGKASVRVDIVLRVLEALGLDLRIEARS